MYAVYQPLALLLTGSGTMTISLLESDKLSLLDELAQATGELILSHPGVADDDTGNNSWELAIVNDNAVRLEFSKI